MVLDGHARLAAAIAESVEPAVLELQRAAPEDEVVTGTRQAVAAYEAELARFAELRAVRGPGVPDGAGTAGPVLARRLLALRAEHRPTWAWPLPGGIEQWHRVAREHDVPGPRGDLTVPSTAAEPDRGGAGQPSTSTS
ncbi:hypothetical protein ACH4U6_15180 [Streptomyces netropsis]|uniref:hypothetical protein n=1 Tax=Streptomyces netropsis TaxID=55404 RepID=UPI003794CCAE